MLRGHESILLQETLPKLSAKQKGQWDERKKKQARSKGRKRPPKIESKTKYFYHVGASDCIKAHSWNATLGLINQNGQTKRKNDKITKLIASSKATIGDMPDATPRKKKKSKPTKLK